MIRYVRADLATPGSAAPAAPVDLTCLTCKVSGLNMGDFTARGEHAGHDIGAPEGHPLHQAPAAQPGSASTGTAEATLDRIRDAIGKWSADQEYTTSLALILAIKGMVEAPGAASTGEAGNA